MGAQPAGRQRVSLDHPTHGGRSRDRSEAALELGRRPGRCIRCLTDLRDDVRHDASAVHRRCGHGQAQVVARTLCCVRQSRVDGVVLRHRRRMEPVGRGRQGPAARERERPFRGVRRPPGHPRGSLWFAPVRRTQCEGGVEHEAAHRIAALGRTTGEPRGGRPAVHPSGVSIEAGLPLRASPQTGRRVTGRRAEVSRRGRPDGQTHAALAGRRARSGRGVDPVIRTAAGGGSSPAASTLSSTFWIGRAPKRTPSVHECGLSTCCTQGTCV